MPTRTEIEIALKAPLLANMPGDLAETLLRQAQVRALTRGETLFVQDERAESAFVVLDGWVKLYRVTPGGDEAVVHVFTRGQSFAEAAAFDRGAYPVSAEAATDCAVLGLRAEALLALLDANPALARAMIAAAHRHLHQLVAQIEALKAQDGAQRVAAFLVSLCPPGEGPWTVTLPYEKGLIAARLGMTPQSLSRAFTQLRAHGVAIQNAEAGIADPDALRLYAEGVDPTG